MAVRRLALNDVIQLIKDECGELQDNFSDDELLSDFMDVSGKQIVLSDIRGSEHSDEYERHKNGLDP